MHCRWSLKNDSLHLIDHPSLDSLLHKIMCFPLKMKVLSVLSGKPLSPQISSDYFMENTIQI